MDGKKRVLIAGCGISGRGAARLADALGFQVILADRNDTEDLRKFASSLTDAECAFSWTEGSALPKADLAVLSPGVSIHSPMADTVRKAAEEVTGELGFAFQCKNSPAAAITGTNGKTTTTELTTLFFRAAGIKAESAGNIGNSLSEAVLGSRKTPPDFLIVETSSFQLESLTDFGPDEAALLNIASDHLDRHGSMEEYAKIKFGIFQKCRHKAVLHADLLPQWKIFYPDAVPVTFSGTGSADFTLDGEMIRYHGKPLLDMQRCILQGRHNAENLMAAFALLLLAAGEEALFSLAVASAAMTFRPDSHRMEFFAERNGIRYCDDSKGTNPHSTAAALRACGREKNVVLLLGGLDKDMNFHELDPYAGMVRKTVLYGRCRDRIFSQLSEKFDCVRTESFEEAVRLSCEAARPGDTVLLSPACASMDLFRNYAERGDRFQALVKEFIGQPKA